MNYHQRPLFFLYKNEEFMIYVWYFLWYNGSEVKYIPNRIMKE